MMRMLSLRNIDDKKHFYVNFTGRWARLMGTPERTGCWIIYGKSGQGKTSFMMQMARELDEIGYRVIILSLEEGTTTSFREALHSNGIITGVHKINVSEGDSAEALDEYLGTVARRPDAIFIDSVQYWNQQFKATAIKIIELRKKYTSTLFIFTSHVQGNEVEGMDAYWVKRDSFCRILVEGFTAHYMGRNTIGRPDDYAGMYTIWKEGAERIALENRKQ